MILSSTKDLIDDYEFAGGPAFYSSLALSFLGFNNFTVFTTESTTYEFLHRLGINLIPCGVGETIFRIEFDGNGRRLKLVRKGYIDLRELTDSLSRYVVISLTMNEVPLDVIKELVNGRRVVVDIQGFMRSVSSDGVVFNDYSVFSKLVKLECDELILRGEWYEFPPKCRGVGIVKCFQEFNIPMIITNSSDLTYFSTNDGIFSTIQPPQLIYGNTLGTGDVFTAVFAYEYLILGASFEEAVAIATSASSLRVRDSIPWFTINEVEALSSKVLRSCRRITY